MREYKLVVLGSGGVGKSALIFYDLVRQINSKTPMDKKKTKKKSGCTLL